MRANTTPVKSIFKRYNSPALAGPPLCLFAVCLLALGLQFCYQAFVKQTASRSVPAQAGTVQPKALAFVKPQSNPR